MSVERVNIIYPPAVTWDSKKQRPHHLFRELGKRGYTIHWIDGNPRRTNFAPSVEEVSENFFVYSNETAFRNSFKNEPFDFNILCTSAPYVYRQSISRTYLPKIDAKWYDYIDDLPERRPGESEMITQSDIVTSSAESLHRTVSSLRGHNEHFYVPNGGDFDLFNKSEKIECMELMGYEDKKIIGFHGAFAYWLDYELLQKIANEFSDCLILLIGNLYPDCKDKMPKNSNVVFLGSKPYEELPDYVSNYDVCILPFNVKDEVSTYVTAGTLPLKVFEYLSSGKPIVSTEMPELVKFSSCIEIVKNDEEFLAKLRKTLEEGYNSKKRIEKCQRIARKYDWDKIGENAFKIINGYIKKVKGVLFEKK